MTIIFEQAVKPNPKGSFDALFKLYMHDGDELILDKAYVITTHPKANRAAVAAKQFYDAFKKSHKERMKLDVAPYRIL